MSTYDFEPEPDDGRGEPTSRAVCRTCGEVCTWHDTGVRMALMDANGKLHTCNVTDDFDNLTED